jgi:hypothetical protein
MVTNWVLVIALYSPSGDFIDKRHEVLPNRKTCVQQRQEINQRDPSPIGVRERAICVTWDHWTGKRPMKDVNMD